MPLRFPPPWRIEPIAAGFKVVDATGFAVAYVYSGKELWAADQQLSADQARRIASAIARLPELVGKPASKPE